MLHLQQNTQIGMYMTHQWIATNNCQELKTQDIEDVSLRLNLEERVKLGILKRLKHIQSRCCIQMACKELTITVETQMAKEQSGATLLTQTKDGNIVHHCKRVMTHYMK